MVVDWGGMNNTQIIILAGSGSLVAIILLVAAYLNGHHNGRRVNQAVPAPPQPKEQFDPGFVLNVMEDGVVMVDTQGVVRLFNPAAGRIVGWKPEEVIGLDFRSILPLVNEHGQTYPPSSHPFEKVLQTNQVARDSKATLISRSGRQVPISLIVSPASPVAASGAVAVFRDITKEKAEESERAEFISTASHEMRTPIAAIEGYLSLALNPKVAQIDPHAKSYLQKAHVATQQLGELFADLLTSSKAEDGRITSYPTAVEVGEVVAQAADVVRFNAQKKDLQLKYQVSSSKEVTGGKIVRPLFYAFVDPNRLREVLQNLIDNAIKYTLEGTITVALTGDNSVIQIQVKDTGAGIPEEDIPHLFQKFYRVDNSMTRAIGGTGLGLFISRKIIEMYNGHIWIESQLGKGSTFFINLPRLSADQALSMQKNQANVVSPLENH